MIKLKKFLCESSKTKSTSNCPFKLNNFMFKKRLDIPFIISAIVKVNLLEGQEGLVSIIIFISFMLAIPKRSDWFSVIPSVMLQYIFFIQSKTFNTSNFALAKMSCDNNIRYFFFQQRVKLTFSPDWSTRSPRFTTFLKSLQDYK